MFGRDPFYFLAVCVVKDRSERAFLLHPVVGVGFRRGVGVAVAQPDVQRLIVGPGQPRLRVVVVDDVVVDFDSGPFRRNFRSRDENASVGKVHLRRDDQVNVPVDARSGVPARPGLQRIVDADGEHVQRIAADERSDVVFERIVPVRVFADHAAVDPYLGFHVDAVETDENAVSFGTGGGFEGMPVPAGSARHEAALRPARIPFVVSACDAPVVRQVELLPTAVVEGRFAVRPVVVQRKTPVAVDIDDFTGFCGKRRRQRGGQQQDRSVNSFHRVGFGLFKIDAS